MLKDSVKRSLDPLVDQWVDGTISNEAAVILRAAIKRIFFNLSGHGKFRIGILPSSGNIAIYSDISDLCGFSKIPPALLHTTNPLVRVADGYREDFWDIIDSLDTMDTPDLTTSWGRAVSRQWVSDRYTEHHGRDSLNWIDPGINRILELLWLAGGRTDVSCEGHPSGSYFRVVKSTPVVKDMLTVLSDPDEGGMWISEDPGPLLPDSLVVRMRGDVGDYETRDTIYHKSVALLEERFSIGSQQVPSDQDGLWCVNRDTN